MYISNTNHNICFSYSETKREEKEEKKEIIQFKNKKEAIEAFKMLLKDKVSKVSLLSRTICEINRVKYTSSEY